MPTHLRFRQPRFQTKKKAQPPFTMQSFYLAIIGAGFLGYVGVDAVDSLAPTLSLSGPCNVKGNVSINTGERIYHLPGQKFYAETKISPQYGERWFCSEAEARAAGWRKALP